MDLGSQGKSFQQLSKELVQNLESVGFVYLKNHGIDEKHYKNCDQMFRSFFRQPKEEKMAYHVPMKTDRDLSRGFFPMESETFADGGVKIIGDARECISFDADFRAANDFMDNDECMRSLVNSLIHQMGKLAKQILHMIGVGLDLEDPHFFTKRHSFHSRGEHHQGSGSFTQMKYNYYPKLEQGLEPGQVQLGEHSDFTTITLLFQDQVGGLQVKNKEKFIPAVPIPGTIILNVGIFLENFTNGKLVGTPHRIIKKMNAERGSTAFFVVPDSDVILSPMQELMVDGKTSYPTVPCGDHRTHHMRKMLSIGHELITEK